MCHAEPESLWILTWYRGHDDEPTLAYVVQEWVRTTPTCIECVSDKAGLRGLRGGNKSYNDYLLTDIIRQPLGMQKSGITIWLSKYPAEFTLYTRKPPAGDYKRFGSMVGKTALANT